MPFLPRGASEFAGVDVFALFESRLVPEGAAASSYLRALNTSGAQFDQWKNFQALSESAVGRASVAGWGIMAPRIPALAEMFAVGPRVTAAQIGKEIVAGTALWTFDQALSAVATKVPIVGWIIRVGLGIFRLVSAILKSRKDDGPKPVGPVQVYNRQADNDLTQRLLELLGNQDWTDLFLPQGRGDFLLQPIDWAGRGKVDGWKYQRQFGDGPGHGIMPGLARVEGMTQFPLTSKLLAQTTRRADRSDVLTLGDIRPSAVQFGMMVWQMVLKNGPQMFAINPSRISLVWKDYYGEMYEFAKGIKDDFQRSMVMDQYSWGDYKRGTSKFPKFNPRDMPSRFVHPTMPLSDLVTYVMNQYYLPRLEPALATITCAYVAPDAPALRGGHPRYAEFHRDMRMKLLEHPARHDVELDLIPDQEYRGEMRRAQLRVTDRFATPTIGQPSPFRLGVDAVPEVIPDPPAEPDNDPGPALEDDALGPGDSDPWPWIIGGTAAAAAVGVGVSWYRSWR